MLFHSSLFVLYEYDKTKLVVTSQTTSDHATSEFRAWSSTETPISLHFVNVLMIGNLFA